MEELRVAEEELRRKNEQLAAAFDAIEAEGRRYRDLFDYAPDAYLVTDPLGIIREANHAAAVLLGVEQRFLVGKPLAVFVPEEGRPAFRAELARPAGARPIAQVRDCAFAPGASNPSTPTSRSTPTSTRRAARPPCDG